MSREQDKSEMMADMLELLLEQMIENAPEGMQEQVKQPFRALRAARGSSCGARASSG